MNDDARITYDLKELFERIDTKLEQLIRDHGEDRISIGRLVAEISYIKGAIGVVVAILGGVILKILGVVG